MAETPTSIAYDASVVGLALLAATEVPNFLAGLLPSIFTIQSFSGGREEAKKSFRKGELIGGMMSLAMGFGASLASQNPLPFIATAITLAIFIGMYEWAMAHPYNQEVSL